MTHYMHGFFFARTTGEPVGQKDGSLLISLLASVFPPLSFDL